MWCRCLIEAISILHCWLILWSLEYINWVSHWRMLPSRFRSWFIWCTKALIIPINIPWNTRFIESCGWLLSFIIYLGVPIQVQLHSFLKRWCRQHLFILPVQSLHLNSIFNLALLRFFIYSFTFLHINLVLLPNSH